MTSILKRKQIVSKTLRNAARDQACVLCEWDMPGEVVLAHLKNKDAGTGQKCDDILGAHLCYTCHQAQEASRDVELSYLALRRTLVRLYDNGVLQIND
jgi:hypothetical protein